MTLKVFPEVNQPLGFKDWLTQLRIAMDEINDGDIRMGRVSWKDNAPPFIEAGIPYRMGVTPQEAAGAYMNRNPDLFNRMVAMDASINQPKPVEEGAKVKFEPIRSMVLVRMDKAPDTFPGSKILTPDSAKERPRMGEVLAAGPGAYNRDGVFIPTTIKAGQVVLFDRYGAHPIPGEEDLVLIDENTLLAVVNR